MSDKRPTARLARPARAALACIFALAFTIVLGGGGGCANGGGASGSGGDDGSLGDVTLEGGGDTGGETSGCSGGKTLCGSTCTNTGNDPKNCGACGNACPMGQVCSTGMCGFSCSPGETLCGGAGAVDATVADTGTQDATSSEAGRSDAGSGTVDSGGGGTDSGGATQPYCANTGNDPMNCGACGMACGAGETCDKGMCTCGPGQRVCIASQSCIPQNSCCNSNDCSVQGQICPTPGGTCACPSGEKACTSGGPMDAGTNSCISNNDCCTQADCMGIAGATCPMPGQACQCANGDKLCIAEKVCIPQGDCCDAMDCPPGSNVKTTTCGTMGTTGGTCSIAACDPGCYDLDKQYPNGCECCDDKVGKSCGAATALGALSLGAAPVTATGVLPGGTESDWFQVNFNSENNTAFHGLIQLTSGGGEYVFDVIQGSCGGAPLNCGEGGGCTGKTAWEESYAGPSPAADPNSPMFAPIPAIGAVWIHVYRANTSMATCNPYTLSVQE